LCQEYVKKTKLYTQVDFPIVFLLRWLCSIFFAFTRALPLGNGRSLQSKNLRSLLVKNPIVKSTCVLMQKNEGINFYHREKEEFLLTFSESL